MEKQIVSNTSTATDFTVEELLAELEKQQEQVKGFTTKELMDRFKTSKDWVREQLVGKGLFVYNGKRYCKNNGGGHNWLPVYIPKLGGKDATTK